MNLKKIIVGALIFSACTSDRSTQNITNAEKNLRIEKIMLFGQNEMVEKFYSNNNFSTVWQDSVNRNELISAIIDSRFDGVLPEKYPLRSLIKSHQNYAYLNVEQLKKTDVFFTEVFFRIAKHLATGKINPKKLYGDWEPFIPNINYGELLESSLENNNIYSSLEDIKPKNELYLKYKKAFAKYVPVISTDTISHEGYLRKKVWVNFERTKWLQPNLGEQYVWINLPQYDLQLIDHGSVVDSYKVIIGKSERRTPVLSSAFSAIIVNPKWTVPPTILKNDVVPKASANRSYFVSNRLTIIDKKSGKIVDPSNWDPLNYQSYKYVQQTGKQNSLGQIKFDFPNKHMVYLHDTNNRARFVESNRALSSGCVRVEDPFKLADAIFKIEGVNVSRTELDTLAVHEKTKNFKLHKKVNVHQVYFTATINDFEEMKILKDVYSLDNMLYRRLIQ